MIKLKSPRHFLVSNRVALLAGLILTITAAASLPGDSSEPEAASGDRGTVEAQPVEPNSEAPRFKVRFLLFRHG